MERCIRYAVRRQSDLPHQVMSRCDYASMCFAECGLFLSEYRGLEKSIATGDKRQGGSDSVLGPQHSWGGRNEDDVAVDFTSVQNDSYDLPEPDSFQQKKRPAPGRIPLRLLRPEKQGTHH